MKKKILTGVLVLVLILCTACGQTMEPETIPTTEPETMPATEPEMIPATEPEMIPATEPETETQSVETQPSEHVCVSACDTCSACTDEQCAEAVCSVKCSGVHQEGLYVFAEGDYITAQAVSVDTGTLVFDIGENVYVPGNLTEMAESLAAALEKVSGLDFDGAGDYGRMIFPDGKVHVKVSRDCLYAGNPAHASWYTGLQTSEQGNAYASSWGHVELSPGDLFLGNSYAVAHELGHMLMYLQSEWSHSQLLSEGFAEYTTYLALQELEEAAPETAVYLTRSAFCIANMEIFDYEKLYEQPLEYWFENTFEYTGNGNYSVGFRFMDYLRDVYGDYSKWICSFEDMYNFRTMGGHSDQSSVDRQIEVLKATYGENVLDGFYPWLKENLDRFDPAVYHRTFSDRTAVESINWYPVYNALETRAKLDRIEYSDLYINLEPLRKYIGEYKHTDVADLVLVTSEPIEVRLYQEDGTFTTVMSDSGQGVPLEGISYIKLVGAGKLGFVEVVGDFRVVW